METLALVALLAAPLLMLFAATRMRRAREQSLDRRGAPRPVSSTSKPWDRGMRNAMLLGLAGGLLVVAGIYAFSVAAGTRAAPLFGAPVVLGVVLVASSYRMWMRAVQEIPDDIPDDAGP
jgi:hypothetical protein